MNGTLDLFDMPVVAGLSTRSGTISRAEERDLIAHIDDAGLSPFRFQQWTGKRLTRSFGWRYDSDNRSFARADAIPQWLDPIRVRAARFAGLEPDALVQALLIRYDPGAGIGWHKDRPLFEHVVGLSLGASTTMRFRRRRASEFERASIPLDPRSIYHLRGEVRHEWEHSIATMVETRWAITFRSLSSKGRALERTL
jgi:alkylated DNA repair dioxygenase AlkB